MDSIIRTKLVLAGDIAYILHKWNEEKSETDRFILKDIYDMIIIKTNQFKKINLSSDITSTEFINAINILIDIKILDLSYSSEKTDLEDTEWRIVKEIDIISFYQLKSLFYLLEQEDIGELPVGRNGFCIRCKRSINLNKDYPYCYYCYRIWANFGDWDYAEKYCHNCGEPAQTSRARPLCHDCYYGND